MQKKTGNSPDNLDAKNNYMVATRNEEGLAIRSNSTVIGHHDFSDLIFSNDRRDPVHIANKNGAATAALSQTGYEYPDDPIESLAAEYRRALSGHENNNTFGLAIEGVPRGSSLPGDPFLDSSPNFLKGSLLQDLLGKNLAINTILSELDQFNTEDLFVEDQPQEILRLLAPDDAAISSYRHTGLLTQREHHMISLDSHLPIFGTTSDNKKDSA